MFSIQTATLPSLWEQGAGSRHHEGQTGEEKERFISLTECWEYSESPSTYNPPTIIIWMGPWRKVILCGNTHSLRTDGHTVTSDISLRSDLHESELFQLLHDDGEDDWEERRERRVRKRRTCRTLWLTYSFLVQPWWSERPPPGRCL